MPIYLYKCAECEHTCEALQRYNDKPLVECPSCHAPALRKIIAPCGIVFKGHGFYKTDNSSGVGVGESTTGSSSGQEGTATGAASENKAEKAAVGEGDPSSKSTEKSGAESAPATKEVATKE